MCRRPVYLKNTSCGSTGLHHQLIQVCLNIKHPQSPRLSSQGWSITGSRWPLGLSLQPEPPSGFFWGVAGYRPLLCQPYDPWLGQDLACKAPTSHLNCLTLGDSALLSGIWQGFALGLLRNMVSSNIITCLVELEKMTMSGDSGDEAICSGRRSCLLASTFSCWGKESMFLTGGCVFLLPSQGWSCLVNVSS